jgi:20S proteasome alpha/beta subunit
MTCIIAQKTKTGIVVGADSGACDGYLQYRIGDSKIWKLSDQLVVGCSGQTRILNVVKGANWEGLTHELSNNYSRLTSHGQLAAKFGSFLRDVLDPHTTKERFGYLLILYGKRIFHVDSEVGVWPVDSNYRAIGSAEELVTGVMYTLNHEKELPTNDIAKQTIEFALKAATHHVRAILPPYTFCETIAEK